MTTETNLTDKKLEAEIAKLMAETMKVNKISAEAEGYQFIAGACAGAAMLVGLLGFIKLMFS
ncbi:MAG: hypothetical protein LBI62_03625 [Candidatus Accumulibacter sp.]|nr:hypothetical protein [Accumulibacter sp.]